MGAVFTFSIPVEINDSSTARKVRAVQVGLKWVIMEPAGARRQPRNFPDPEFALLRGMGSHVGGRDPLPRYRGYEKLLRATQNKSLGTNHDDDWGSLFKECLAVPIEETWMISAWVLAETASRNCRRKGRKYHAKCQLQTRSIHLRGLLCVINRTSRLHLSRNSD